MAKLCALKVANNILKAELYCSVMLDNPAFCTLQKKTSPYTTQKLFVLTWPNQLKTKTMRKPIGVILIGSFIENNRNQRFLPSPVVNSTWYWGERGAPRVKAWPWQRRPHWSVTIPPDVLSVTISPARFNSWLNVISPAKRCHREFSVSLSQHGRSLPYPYRPTQRSRHQFGDSWLSPLTNKPVWGDKNSVEKEKSVLLRQVLFYFFFKKGKEKKKLCCDTCTRDFHFRKLIDGD